MFVLRLRRWQSRTGWLHTGLRWRELNPYFPGWALATVVALFGYAVANFLLATSHLPTSTGATASFGSGAPVGSHSQAVYTARALSGHWLIFYGLPALFFLYVPSGARPTSDEKRHAGAA